MIRSLRYNFLMPFPVVFSEKFLHIAEECHVHPEHIEEHFTYGAGPGGQKKNKTSSCVELTHHPTGIVVRMQRFREQSRNRIAAYELLLLKIEEYYKGVESALAHEEYKRQKQMQRRPRRAKEKMLQEKRKRGETKEGRRGVETE